MNLDLTDAEAAALTQELHDIVERGLEREKRIAALRGRRAELRILYRSCPPAHRQRVRGLIADIEEELRDLGDEPGDARLDLNDNLLT
jgi:chromosome segregation ATPase